MTEWTDHLQTVREKNPTKSLKECMKIASVSYKGNTKSKSSSSLGGNKSNRKTNKESLSQTNNHVSKSDKKGDKKKLKKESKETLQDIVGFSKDLLSVTDILSADHLKMLQKACKKIHHVHEELRSKEEESSDEESSDDDSDSD